MAEFIGNPKINFLPGTVNTLTDAVMTVESDFGHLKFDRLAKRSNGVLKNASDTWENCDVTMAIRPEDIIVSREERPGYVPCRIASILPAGSETLMELQIGDHLLMAKEIGLQQYETDDQVWVFLKQQRMNIYENRESTLIVRAL